MRRKVRIADEEPAAQKACARAPRREKPAWPANPPTGFPGGSMIEEEVARRIHGNIPFAFLRIGINHFKSYNDAHGLARGARVIRTTAEILMESLQGAGGRDWFVGHIGGDDFVVVTAPTRAPHVAQRIASRFDRRAGGFYKASDGSPGCARAGNRHGRRECRPALSLSIGIVTSERRKLDHYAKVVRIASEMKAYCRSLPGERLSRFAFDRRREF